MQTFSKEDRLEIGRRIYVGEINKQEASRQYGICVDTARNYMRLYRDTYHLPPKSKTSKNSAAAVQKIVSLPKGVLGTTPPPLTGLAALEAMSKEELVRQIIQLRINELRLKKGYMVKGDGTVVLYGKENTK